MSETSATRRSNWLAAIGYIVLIAFLVGSISFTYRAYRTIQGIANLPNQVERTVKGALAQPTPTVTVLPPAIDQLRPLARLQTEAYFLSTVVDVTIPRGLLEIWPDDYLLLVACGKVTAGVDLKKLTEDDVRVNNGTVIIRLPPAEIFDVFLFEDRDCTYVYRRKEAPLVSPNEVIESEARQQAVESFRQTALDNGILERAQRNAEQEIRRLLQLVGYDQVEFVTSE